MPRFPPSAMVSSVCSVRVFRHFAGPFTAFHILTDGRGNFALGLSTSGTRLTLDKSRNDFLTTYGEGIYVEKRFINPVLLSEFINRLATPFQDL